HEARPRARCPNPGRLERLAKNLFLLAGIADLTGATVQGQSECDLRKAAEGLLAAARKGGDRFKEIAALTDLGVLATRAGEGQRAVALLEEARALARQAGDPGREGEVLGNLAMAALAAGQPARAQELLESRLAQVRTAGDRFAEKITLENLGLVQSSWGDHPGAVAWLEQ